MRVISIFSGLVFAVSLYSPALADAALDLWAQGKYEEAIAAGVAEKTPEGLSAAAQAATTALSLHAMPCPQCIQRAEDLGHKALAADPKSTVPSFCLAAALAYHGRMIGTINVQGAQIGIEARRVINEALAVHPDNARLIAAMGIWNFEVVRVAGSILARMVYGANMDSGLALFDQAFKLTPNDVLLNFQYGLSLAAYDPDEYRPKIEAAWERVVATRPQNAYDEEMKSRAVRLLALLKSGDKKILDATVKDYLGIPG